MKILTWNLERPKKVNHLILKKLSEFDADILILTETNSAINLGKKYSFVSTDSLFSGFDGIDYIIGENRTTIWSKYEIKSKFQTYDNFTSVCVQIETEYGLLNVYGTIIGVFGGKGVRFKNDLNSQILDFNKFALENYLCVAGDFNVMFSGLAYPSHESRNKLNTVFDELNLENLTSKIENNVDHIVLSKDFLANKKIEITIWNEDKKLSDHIGICLDIK